MSETLVGLQETVDSGFKVPLHNCSSNYVSNFNYMTLSCDKFVLVSVTYNIADGERVANNWNDWENVAVVYTPD